MINISEVLETNKMILEENLDVRTITMGISLLDCADESLKVTCDKIYAKLMRLAKDLVKTGDDIGREFGGRDHTTVLHSLEQIEKKIKQDDIFAQTIREITININSKN